MRKIMKGGTKEVKDQIREASVAVADLKVKDDEDDEDSRIKNELKVEETKQKIELCY